MGARRSDAAPTFATQFIAAHRDVVLFCRDAGGAPIGYPMRCTSVSGSAVHFTTYRKSAKVRHLERDPAVHLLCSVATGEDSVEWVDASGTVTIWSPAGAELDRLLSGPRDGRVPAGMLDHVRGRLLDGKRVMLTVEVEHAQRYRGTTAGG